MLIISIRVVLALILIAAVPYTLTVAIVVVMWLDENFHAILSNDATRRFRSTPIVMTSVVPRNAVRIPGRPRVIRALLGMKWVKKFDTDASKSASWQELHRAALVETDRGKLTSLVGTAEPTIVHRRPELTVIEDGVQEQAATLGAAQQLVRSGGGRTFARCKASNASTVRVSE